jgi:Fe-S cluster assembly iron-binding protein IscA
MLAVTEGAAAAIGGILASPELPEEAGVRISSEISPAEGGATRAEVHLAVVSSPEPSDEVIDEAPVYLEPDAAVLLEGKQLDADIVGHRVHFNLRERA